MKKFNKKSINFILLSSIFIMGILPFTSNFTPSEDNNQIFQYNNPNAGYWTNFTWIHVDNNWTDFEDYDWVKGDGSWSDPYIIEDIVMDASSSPTGSGILIQNSNSEYFIIRNCTIYGANGGDGYGGIRLRTAVNGKLYDNNCSGNSWCGISLTNFCSNNTIQNNTVNNNNRGIYVELSTSNYLINNTANINGRGIYLTSSQGNMIYNNTANNNTESGIRVSNSIWCQIKDNKLYGNEQMGIVAESNYLTIDGNTLNKSGNSIIGYQDDNHNTITNNIIVNESSANYAGIYMYGNQNQTIAHNFINGMGSGIFFRDSHFNNVSYNYINESTNNGIRYFNDASNNNTFYKNNITNNGASGFQIYESSKNNSIIENRIISNQRGIYFLFDDNDNNTVTGNIISDNSVAGIELDANSDYNIIYNNTFTGVGTYAVDNGIGNSWFQGNLGNYWDDYTGSDLTGDGI